MLELARPTVFPSPQADDAAETARKLSPFFGFDRCDYNSTTNRAVAFPISEILEMRAAELDTAYGGRSISLVTRRRATGDLHRINASEPIGVLVSRYNAVSRIIPATNHRPLFAFSRYTPTSGNSYEMAYPAYKIRVIRDAEPDMGYASVVGVGSLRPGFGVACFCSHESPAELVRRFNELMAEGAC